MLNGSETWGPKEPELRQLHRNDRAMIRWICGIKDRDETPSDSLLQKRDIEDVTTALRCRRLGQNGHVQRATSCIKSITNFQISGTRKNERPRRTWSECVKTDVKECGLAGVDPLDQLTEMHGEPVFETETQTVWYCVFKRPSFKISKVINKACERALFFLLRSGDSVLSHPLTILILGTEGSHRHSS